MVIKKNTLFHTLRMMFPPLHLIEQTPVQHLKIDQEKKGGQKTLYRH